MIIDGRRLAKKVLQSVRRDLSKLPKRSRPLQLAAILVGRDPASLVFLEQKRRRAEELGIGFRLWRFPQRVAFKKLAACVKALNRDTNITGIIIQLPLPQRRGFHLLGLIDPAKDIDGLTPANLGRILWGDPHYLPAAVLAVLEILRSLKLQLAGKRVALIGFTPLVNMPLALLFGQAKATLNILQEESNLKEGISQADLVVSAVGQKHLVRGNWIKKGAVVIDVGIVRQGKKIYGDVEFERAARRAAFITPVPGGVGPLTVACLFRNLVQAAKLRGL